MARSTSLEIVSEGVNALVIPKDDPASLARAIVRMMDDEKMRTSFGRAATAAVTPFRLDNALRAWDATVGW